MQRLKINGLHTGASGYGVPKEMYQQLDAANISFMAKTADGSLYDAIQVARARVNAGKENIHTIIWRRSLKVDGSSYDPNVPDYNDTPYNAAARHWAFHKANLPQEIRDNRDILWLETVNEVNKDSDEVVEWLAEFAIHTAGMMGADGYRWAAFGWAGGNPEPHHWRGPKMVEFLRLCAANPGWMAVALHEYSWTTDDIWNGRNGEDYSLIGRFTKLIEACDDFNIAPYPNIFITEWGWAERNIPAPDKAISDILEVGELYARYPSLKGAAVWYLGGGFGDIHHQTNQIVDLLWQQLLTKTYDVDVIEPPIEPPDDKHLAIVVKLPQTMTESEWLDACRVAYEFRHTVTASHDDMLTVLRGGNDESYVKASHPDRDEGALQMVVDAGYGWEPLYSNPGQPFALTNWPTEYKTVTQRFGANPDYYEPFGLPGHEGVDIRATLGSKVFAAAPGRVFYVENNPDAHNYGIHIRIEHDEGYQTIYAHLQAAYAAIDDIVPGGTVIGLANNTGNSIGSHLHFGMKHPAGMEGWPSNIIDPTPYLQPFNPTWPDTPPPPMGKTYPVDFLRADPQAWRVIRRADGSGEDVWDLPTIDGFVRVKNREQGEWYSPTGKLRYLDTSPANDSQGNERLYKLFTDGEQGGRIAPDVAEVGKVYSYPVTVQFYRKGNCQPLPENSGAAVSIFQLVEVRDNYTLSTGVTVDRLFVTIQTGETQLYAIKDGRKLGWVGGGASQDNNIWGGELAELYFDRNIPQTEPKHYCG